MDKFCSKCGAQVDQSTGMCTKCGQKSAETKPITTDKKEEKKRAWKEAKKRYKEDVSVKKKNKKKVKKSKKKAKLAAMSKKQKVVRVFLKLAFIILILGLLVGGVYLALKNLGIISDDKKQNSGKNEKTTVVTPSSDDDDDSSESDSNDTNDTNDSDVNNSVGDKGSNSIDNPPTEGMPAEYEVATPDAEKYYNENSEVVSEMDASAMGRTEAEAYKNLTERGFTIMPIITNYTMDGSYIEEQSISGSGTDKHPMYSTLYITDDGLIWNIYEINGAVFANPVWYNSEYELDVPVMISETETITSYDSTLNKFFVTKPKEAALDVKKVKKIDAETLNALTAQEINELEGE